MHKLVTDFFDHSMQVKPKFCDSYILVIWNGETMEKT